MRFILPKHRREDTIDNDDLSKVEIDIENNGHKSNNDKDYERLRNG